MQEKAWFQCKVAAWVPSPWALPAPSLLAQPLQLCFFLDLSGCLLSASPPALAEPTQRKAATPVIAHWKQEVWVTFLFISRACHFENIFLTSP